MQTLNSAPGYTFWVWGVGGGADLQGQPGLHADPQLSTRVHVLGEGWGGQTFKANLAYMQTLNSAPGYTFWVRGGADLQGRPGLHADPQLSTRVHVLGEGGGPGVEWLHGVLCLWGGGVDDEQ